MQRSLVLVLSILVLLGACPSALALTADELTNITAHERVARSVVLILVRGVDFGATQSSPEIRVTGSGFAIEPELVVTNYHVVEKAARIEIVLQGGDHADAVVVGTAPSFDLALLRVPIGPDRLPPATIGLGLDLRIGQKILAVSNAFGIWHSLSVGVVSGVRRELPGLDIGASLIQFDAALNPGQSGGPLVDSDGRVVGVTTAKILRAEAIGFAIPVEIVTHVLPDLKEMGHPFRPQLGYKGTTVDADLATLFDLPARNGVMVEEVDPGSLAEKIGLTPGRRRVELGGREYLLGGDIIVSIGDAPIQGNEDLVLRVLTSRPGEKLALTVVNASGRRTVNLIIPSMTH